MCLHPSYRFSHALHIIAQLFLCPDPPDGRLLWNHLSVVQRMITGRDRRRGVGASPENSRQRVVGVARVARENIKSMRQDRTNHGERLLNAARAAGKIDDERSGPNPGDGAAEQSSR